MLLPWGFREYPGDFSLSGRGRPPAWGPGRNSRTSPGWPAGSSAWPWRRPGARTRPSSTPWPRTSARRPRGGRWPPRRGPRSTRSTCRPELDAWLAGPGLRHELLGLTGVRDGPLDLADLTAGELPRPLASAPGIGSVTTAARPAGPGGVTRPCVICGVYLVSGPGGQRYAVLLRGPADDDPRGCVRVQVTAADQAAAGQILDRIRALAVQHNVYRGQVISFGRPGGPGHGSAAGFLDRPRLDRATVILPPDLLDGIERQVLGIARHCDELSASGQHLKRGVLLHGPPGTGKTHTVRYLIGQLPDVTAIVISGAALRFIGEACAIARTLQPSIVVVEDVELAAEPRGPHAPLDPLLLQLRGEMEGLSDDANVTFLLTTNRADLLEEALAARPGQVDHTARLPLPDAAARRRLIRLYAGGLRISRASAGEVVARTDGVNASFIRELLRRAAVHAADGRAARAGATASPLRVSARHLNLALDELLDVRHDLTRVLLGSRPMRGADAVIRPVLPHLRPSRDPRLGA